MDMASTLTLSLSPSTATTTSRSYLSHTKHGFRYPRIKLPSSSKHHHHRVFSASASASSSSSSSLEALIFDCDGVILESEHLHRQAYNDAFLHFNVGCPSSSSSPQPLNWGIEFYDELQNQIGGGKPKMRWFSLSPPNLPKKFPNFPSLALGMCFVTVLFHFWGF